MDLNIRSLVCRNKYACSQAHMSTCKEYSINMLFSKPFAWILTQYCTRSRSRGVHCNGHWNFQIKMCVDKNKNSDTFLCWKTVKISWTIIYFISSILLLSVEKQIWSEVVKKFKDIQISSSNSGTQTLNALFPKSRVNDVPSVDIKLCETTLVSPTSHPWGHQNICWKINKWTANSEVEDWILCLELIHSNKLYLQNDKSNYAH